MQRSETPSSESPVWSLVRPAETQTAVPKALVSADSPQLVIKGASFIQNFTSILEFSDLPLDFII